MVFIVLILVTVFTNYYGSTDLGDYADVAKFFAGKYSADIRSSHSYLYGFMMSPFVWLIDSFFFFKLVSLVLLYLIIYSVYIISKGNSRTLWLITLSPIVWYMAPWINPIQIASLFLLWSWHFLCKYDKTEKISDLFFSAVFLGLGWAFWDTILFLGLFLTLFFLYDKKAIHVIYFLLFILIGLVPRFLLDTAIFNFPFFSILKSTFGTISNAFFFGRGSTYVSGSLIKNFFTLVPIFLAVPIYYWKLYKSSLFKENKKTMLFLSFSVLLIIITPQERYVLAVAPIMIVLLGKVLNKEQIKRQLIFSVFVILLFIFPYIMQITHNIDDQIRGADFGYIARQGFVFEINREFTADIIREDLESILEENKNETFLVGPLDDSYQVLADLYWGDQVKEFVSLQDYEFNLLNQTTIFQKTIMPQPRINNRRKIWIAGGININDHDQTDFNAIEYLINFGANAPQGFELIKEHRVLSLWKKKG